MHEYIHIIGIVQEHFHYTFAFPITLNNSNKGITLLGK